jgi:hypothetical protein
MVRQLSTPAHQSDARVFALTVTEYDGSWKAAVSCQGLLQTGFGDAAEAAVLEAFSLLWAEVSRRCPTCGQVLPEAKEEKGQ